MTTSRRPDAQAEWLRSLPQEVVAEGLRPQEMIRLIGWAERFAESRSPELLARVEAEAYRLAQRLEPLVGHTATLHYLRDSLVRALRITYGEEPEVLQAMALIAGRVSDGIWAAHTDALQHTIRRQQQERLHQELTLAKRIQERLLPRTIPQIPGFDIAGRVLQAEEVGGDYWSCKSYPEDELVTIKLADVTGHGIAAATLVAAVKFISGGFYRGAKTAAQVMDRTNHVLVKETPHEILVTMVYGWLYPQSREMSVVNAGHSPVLHYHEGEWTNIPPTGIALGMVETRYRQIRLAMEPGDIFFTCSDGITAPSGEQALGEDWLREQVSACAHLRASEMVDEILSKVLKVYKTPLDDMSILIVKSLP